MTDTSWNALPTVITAHLTRDDAGGEFTFTTTFTGADVPDAEHVDIVQRLEGDFPGGVADLHYRFTWTAI